MVDGEKRATRRIPMRVNGMQTRVGDRKCDEMGEKGNWRGKMFNPKCWDDINWRRFREYAFAIASLSPDSLASRDQAGRDAHLYILTESHLG